MPMRLPQTVTRRNKRAPETAPGGQDWDGLLIHRVHHGLDIDQRWRRDAEEALLYYDSDLYKSFAFHERNRDRARVTINYVRGDVDRKVGTILDGAPIVRPAARHPSYHLQAQAMIDLVQYSRDSELDYQITQEEAVLACFQIGEAVMFEGWDQRENQNKGGAVARRIDARNVLTDPASVRPQHDDAQYIIVLSWESVWDIQKRFGIDSVQHEHENLLYSHWLNGGDRIEDTITGGPRGDERAWVITMYHRTYDTKTRFGRHGKEMDLTADEYGLLSAENKEEIDVAFDETEYLWECSMVNGRVVEHRLSPYDKSLGGHGMYPMSFYKCVKIDGRHRARGEISFIKSISDVRNETYGASLDHMWLTLQGYLDVPSGAYRPEEAAKLQTIGEERFSVIERQSGMQPAEWRGTNLGSSQVFQQAMPLLDQIQNRESGVYASQRGQAEFAGQSGKLARVLDAVGERVNVLSQHRVESGLKRSLLLRLHNIGQFTQSTFLAEVVNPDTKERRALYVGRNYQQIVSTFNLQPVPHPTTGAPVFVDEAGQPANILAITEDLKASNLFEQIRLTLDTDRRAQKAERAEIAQAVINIGGPAALPWYAKVVELEDADFLLDLLDQANQEKQVFAQLEELAKAAGLQGGVQELVQTITQQLQRGLPSGDQGSNTQAA